MFRKQRFTGVIGGKLAPIQPLVSSLSPSLSKTNDSTLLDVPVIYTSAPDTLCLRSLFHRCYAVCVCVWRATRSGGKERGRERKEHRGSLVSLYFIEWNETPAGGLIKGYGTWWESLKIRKKKKETRVHFVIYFVWKYICELISKTGWIFFFFSILSCRDWKGKNFVNETNLYLARRKVITRV